MAASDLLAQLTSGAPGFAGADLAGVDVHGAGLNGCALPGADLRGADLRNARLVRVDLSLANLRGAKLEGASFRFCNLIGAKLDGAQGSHLQMEHCVAHGAQFTGCVIPRSMWVRCDLGAAEFEAADLTRSYIVSCDCDGARFRGTTLVQLATLGSRFVGAALDTARGFWRSHEIVQEILGRELSDGDFEVRAALAAVTAERRRCYADWAAWLAEHPPHADLVRRVFAAYPASGCLEALAKPRLRCRHGTRRRQARSGRRCCSLRPASRPPPSCSRGTRPAWS